MKSKFSIIWQRISLLFLTLGFISTSFGQSITSTSVTESRCKNSGTITVNASGGQAPLTYAITAGPQTTSYFSALASSPNSYTFSSLAAGTYTVSVRDNTGNVVSASNIVVTGNYVDMTPTTTATNTICSGTSTGSITLSMPSGQGRSPYTYTVVSGTTMLPASNPTASNSYVYTGLAAGNYSVRVYDSCGTFQTRTATVLEAPNYTNFIYNIIARPETCDSMTYYLIPSLGSNYPFTMYAYKDGDTNTITATKTFYNSDLVPVPSTNYIGMKMTLPNPSTFCGGSYKFRFVDMCGKLTALKEMIIGNNFGVTGNSATTCGGNNLIISNLQGFKYPLNINITPTATSGGSTTATHTISNINTSNDTFLAPGAGNYTLTITDDCGRSCSKTVTVNAINKSITFYSKQCASHLDSTAAVTFNISGVVQPMIVEVLSGPATYNSTKTNISLSKTYPDTIKYNLTNPWFGINNLPVGPYTFKATDACGSVLNFAATITTADVQNYTFSHATIGGCAGSRYIKIAPTSNCMNVSADIFRVSSNSYIGIGALVKNGYTFNNVANGTYYIYYYAAMDTSISLFDNPNRHPRLPTSYAYGLLYVDTVVVTSPPVNPIILGLRQAGCGGVNNIQVMADSISSPKPFTYEILSGPNGYTAAAQSSPIFTGLNAGTYSFRLVDSCGNATVQSLSVGGLEPVPIYRQYNCYANDSATLTFTQSIRYSDYYWIKPDGSISYLHTLSFAPVTNADTGNYTLVAKSTIGACTDSVLAVSNLTTCSVVLPIELINFRVKKINDYKALLTWTTLSEHNNSRFEIEHSLDAKHWQKTGIVKTQAVSGNSNDQLNYRFVDENLENGNNFYRLMQVDNDETSSYSNSVLLFVDNGQSINIFPNPAKQEVTINNLPSHAKIEIFDILGRMLKQEEAETATLKLNINDLNNGTYHLIVSENDRILKSIKLSVMK